MDMSDKVIDIKSMSSNHESQETNVTFVLLKALAEDLNEKVGEYTLNLNNAFAGRNDARLLLAIKNRMEQI